MHKFFTLILATGLAACTNNAVILEAINYDVGPPSEASQVKLTGTSLNSENGWGLSREQGATLFRHHQHQPVNYIGTIDAIQVRGNQAEIELIPVKPAGQKKHCTVMNLRNKYGCKEQQTTFFTNATCIVDDWAALNRKTQGVLLDNLKHRHEDFRRWNWLKVEGTLTNYIPKTGKILKYSSGSSQGTYLPGFYNATWAYESFVITN